MEGLREQGDDERRTKGPGEEEGYTRQSVGDLKVFIECTVGVQ